MIKHNGQTPFSSFLSMWWVCCVLTVLFNHRQRRITFSKAAAPQRAQNLHHPHLCTWRLSSGCASAVHCGQCAFPQLRALSIFSCAYWSFLSLLKRCLFKCLTQLFILLTCQILLDIFIITMWHFIKRGQQHKWWSNTLNAFLEPQP